MTDTPNTPAPTRKVVPYQPPVDSSSMAIAGEAWKIASKVAHTDFVPKAMRGSPESVLACILTGHEVGISPMAALSKIHVVDGRPAMAAELMRALVLERGHEIWIEEASTTRVIVKGQRRGSERISTVTWTKDDAERAKLWGKHNWRAYPRAMLLARATTELCRMLFPDVLAGISHTVEELADGEGELVDVLGAPEVVQAETAQNARSESTSPTPLKARHRATADTGAPDPGEITPDPEPARGEIPDLPGEEPEIIEAEVVDETPAPEPEPEVEHVTELVDEDPDDALPENEEAWPDEDDPPNENDPGPRYTGPQVIAMKLNALGIRDRPRKLRAVEQILDRERGSLSSTNDLSSDDVAKVIEYLEELPEGTNLLVDEEPPPAPEPRTEAVTPVEQWDEDRWRKFLQHRKIKVAPTMKEAQRLAHEAGLEKTIATLGDIPGSGIEAELVGWIEEQ